MNTSENFVDNNILGRNTNLYELENQYQLETTQINVDDNVYQIDNNQEINIDDYDFKDLDFEDFKNEYDVDELIDNICKSDSNIEQSYEKLIDYESQLNKLTNIISNISIFVDLCNLLKNFKYMDYKTKLGEIECFLISLRTSDKFVNGLFRFFKDVINQGKFKFKNFVNLSISIAEKYLNLPIENACKFIVRLLKGKSVKDFIKPLILDLTSILVPQISIIKMIDGILQGIKSLLKKQSIKNVSGIDLLYTDEIKIKYFKVRHKISYENEFLDK